MPDVLRSAYNNLDPSRPLDWGDDRYVDLSGLGVRGTDTDLVRLLETTIALSEDATHQLVSGFRGCGKTTELRRLGHSLRQKGYRVIDVDAESLINLTTPISLEDVWLAIAAGVDDHLSPDARTGELPGLWERFHRFLQTDVKLDSATLKGGPAELKLSFGSSLDVRARIYAALGERKSQVVRLCRDFVEESLGDAAGSGAPPSKTVLILDSLEKLRGTFSNAGEVRASVERVFGVEYRELEADFHTVFTVPPWMAFTQAYGQGAFGTVRVLPMCRVHSPDTGEPYPEGIAAMRKVLERRMDIDAIFGAAERVEELIEASGGYTRGLFQLVRDVLVRARTDGTPLPIPADDLGVYIERVLTAFAGQFELALNDENLPLIARVHRQKSARCARADDAHRYAELFETHFVLAYQNGEAWFDVHPLLKRLAVVRKALANDLEA